MKIILLSDVKKVGKKGDLVEVSDGYANNFLIRQNLAVPANEYQMNKLKLDQANEAEKQAQLKKEAETEKEKLKNKEFVFKVKAKDGKVSGSVSTKQLAQKLKEEGFEIDKRKIIDAEPLSTLGYNIVKVELYKDVIAEIKVKLEEE